VSDCCLTPGTQLCLCASRCSGHYHMVTGYTSTVKLALGSTSIKLVKPALVSTSILSRFDCNLIEVDTKAGLTNLIEVDTKAGLTVT
jgi:hypothetical protein